MATETGGGIFITDMLECGQQGKNCKQVVELKKIYFAYY
jgi:hypothetical protein